MARSTTGVGSARPWWRPQKQRCVGEDGVAAAAAEIVVAAYDAGVRSFGDDELAVVAAVANDVIVLDEEGDGAAAVASVRLAMPAQARAYSSRLPYSSLLERADVAVPEATSNGCCWPVAAAARTWHRWKWIP